jgi:AcrR family transcriptional regulator
LGRCEKLREHESAERIKKVSMKLFNHKGYEATTIRDICNEIGITAPSFYYYFDSKELLYLQMIKECEALHQAAITEAIDSCPSQIAEDRLNYVFKALLNFMINGLLDTNDETAHGSCIGTVMCYPSRGQ